jgi:sortase (surface protein transpeptidase)
MAKRIIRIFVLILSMLIFLSGVYLIYQILAPEIEYRVDKPDVDETIQIIQSETGLDQNRLYIPSIGVDMEIGSDEQFLDFGGWVQEVGFDGTPELIAIHRFGFNGLSPDQKIRQTLYHVNKLDEGDVFYLVWDNVLYEYKVKDIVDGTNNPNSEYLIIYTCKFINSNERTFVTLQSF